MRSKFVGRFTGSVLAIIVLSAMLGSPASAANSETVQYSFAGQPDGGHPHTWLIFNTSGRAYGVTPEGGFGFGTIFQLTRGSNGKWTETVLYSFFGGADGKNPYGGLAMDKAGNLYGVTAAGGAGGVCAGDGCGVVFQLSFSGGTWNENVLYSFKGVENGHTDGFGPGNGVVFDKKGNLYGATPDGGTHSHGIIYQLSTVKGGGWKETVIHNFTGGSDGATGSLGPLLLDKIGNIYGVAETGGTHSAGAAFKLSPVSGGKWKMTPLYDFKGQPDAGSPYGGLIQDAAGNLYGTTIYGGTSTNCPDTPGCGSVFKLSKNSNGTWKETVLYSFKGGTDGSLTTTTLVFDKLGNLYGTTSTGGRTSCDCGTIFKLAPVAGGKWKESVVHRFGSGADGSSPNYGLTPRGGNFYSTTPYGGSQKQGTVFELTP